MQRKFEGGAVGSGGAENLQKFVSMMYTTISDFFT